MPEFEAAWDAALTQRLPALERAAWTRAVEGWLDPIVYRGEIVGHRRRYSDTLLRAMLTREDERQRVRASTQRVPSREESTAAILKQLEIAERQMAKQREREEAEGRVVAGEGAEVGAVSPSIR